MAEAEELDRLDQELRGMGVQQLDDEVGHDSAPPPMAIALVQSVVQGSTIGMGELEVVMEQGADEDDDGGLRNEDEDFS